MAFRFPMKLPAHVKLVPAFKCTHDGCTARAYSTAQSAARHGRTCIANPAERTCRTCEHDGGLDDRDCQLGARPAGAKLVRKCPQWQAIDFG